MAKKSTLILKVDLDCSLCYKKIRRTLCQLQDRWNIQTIDYNEKNNTVTISGPFDPDKLSKKLCCKACKVIKEIQIQEEKPNEAPPPPPPPPPPEQQPEPPPVQPTPGSAPVVVVVVEQASPVQDPPKPETAPPNPKLPEPEPTCPPVWPYGPVCCCWYHGACRCCSCGRWGPVGPPVVYGGPCYDGYKTCELICEEDTSCRIM